MIRLEHLTHTWPDFSIRDVTLTIDTRDYFVIVGPTGAGKTLLLELILGIHQPDEGRIFIGDIDVTARPPEKRNIGMVYQDYVLFPHLSVEQNLAFALRYRSLSKDEQNARIHSMARLLGIEHLLTRRPHTLSGGEKQRVAIGRALIPEPEILLLDEPLSALDRGTAARLRGELRSLHASRELTIVHVTHDLSEARQMGKTLALLNHGTVHDLGKTQSLLRNPPSLFAAEFLGAVNVFEGHIESRAGQVVAVAGPIEIATPSVSRSVYIIVQPAEIHLTSPGLCDRSNLVLSGEIIEIRSEGNYDTVTIRVDGLREPLIAYASPAVIREKALHEGGGVTADLSNAIHVIEDSKS
jgi:ABC-type sugar transport system ATPase subunit